MKKEVKRRTPPGWAVTLIWVAGIFLIWEIGAFIVGGSLRTPENTLPHIWQIIASVFDPSPVSNRMSAILIVLTSAGETLLRALLGFLIGSAAGFCWPC